MNLLEILRYQVVLKSLLSLKLVKMNILQMNNWNNIGSLLKKLRMALQSLKKCKKNYIYLVKAIQ